MPLRPGDNVSLAEDDIAFEVQVALPAPRAAAVAAHNGSNASAAAASGADLAPSPVEAAAADQQAAAALPAVAAALRLAAAQEAHAAAQGLFPPGGAVYADVGDRARQLLAAGSYDQAYVLLLAGAMQQPWAAGERALLCSRWASLWLSHAAQSTPPIHAEPHPREPAWQCLSALPRAASL